MREVEVYSCNKTLAEEELKSGHKYLTVDMIYPRYMLGV